MTRRRPTALVAALAVAALLASGCGSTVRAGLDAGAVQAGVPGDQLVADGGFSVPGATTTAGTGGTAAVGGVPGTTGTTTTAGGAATGGVPAGGGATGGGATGGGATPGGGAAPSAPAGQPSAPGQPAAPAAGSTEPIRLGFPIIEGATNVTNGLGTEVSFGDGQLEVQAVVDAVNAAGGIGGRPIEPYFAGVDFGTADPDADYNAACTELTQDRDVFAVLTPINPPESFVACVANSQTILLNASFNPGDEGLYREFGDWFFSPSLMSLDTGARLMLDALQADGSFDDPLAKVGVLYTGDPQGPRVLNTTIIPRLEQLGVPYVTAEATEVPQVSAAQLQFAANGVTIVMFVHPSGIAQLLFMQASENQGYRPLYMTTDSDSTRFVSENVPRGQAERIRGVGSLPIANVPVQSHPTTARETQCLDIIRAGGEDNRDRLTNITATIYCELVWSFEAIAEAAGPASLSEDSFRQAYRTFGSSYQPVTTFAIDPSTRNDGAAQYRPYAYDSGCSCLAYTGPPVAVPR